MQALPTLFLRFDIDKAGGGFYGIACYKALFSAVPVQSLEEVAFYDGDSRATLEGRENIYLIAMQSQSPALLAIALAKLQQDGVFQRIAATPPFYMAPTGGGEPLVLAGVARDGALSGESSPAHMALASLPMAATKPAPIPIPAPEPEPAPMPIPAPEPEPMPEPAREVLRPFMPEPTTEPEPANNSLKAGNKKTIPFLPLCIAGGALALAWALLVPLAGARLLKGRGESGGLQEITLPVEGADSTPAPQATTKDSQTPKVTEIPVTPTSTPSPQSATLLEEALMDVVEEVALDAVLIVEVDENTNPLINWMVGAGDYKRSGEAMYNLLLGKDFSRERRFVYELYLPDISAFEAPTASFANDAEKLEWLEKQFALYPATAMYNMTCFVNEKEISWLTNDLNDLVAQLDKELEDYFSSPAANAPVAASFPKTGVLSEYDKTKYGVLRFKAAEGDPTYIKLYDTGGKLIKTLFINSGESYTTDMPKGSFEARYATGPVWYGEEDMFGEEGVYQKADTVLKFSAKGDGYEITLEKVVNGNLGSIPKSREDF